MSVKTITTVREYDEHGRVTKETVTEVEHTTPVVPDVPQWWQPQPYPWTWPTITVTSGSNTARPVLVS